MSEDKCPKCGSEKLEFGACEHTGCGQLYYPVECKECGFTGRQWYDVVFSGFTDDEGNDIIAIVLKEGKDVEKLYNTLAGALGEQP